MSAKNVKTLRAAHESWNKRDFAGVVRNAAEGLGYTDHGRNITLNTREKFREWTEEWAKGFSDGRITNPQYIDAGDIVIAQFKCEGTNDGPFASLQPTGRKMSLPFCEICHFDKQAVHGLDPTRAHPIARRGSVGPAGGYPVHSLKRRAPPRLFPVCRACSTARG
jgi:predicted ester cyclase